MTGKKIDLAAALDEVSGSHVRANKVEQIFGNNEKVLQSIRDARLRHVSWKTISKVLSSGGEYVSATAIKNWYEKDQGRGKLRVVK